MSTFANFQKLADVRVADARRAESGGVLLERTRQYVTDNLDSSLLKNPTRERLLDLVVPYWLRLSPGQRRILSAEMHAYGLTDKALCENLVAYAKHLIESDPALAKGRGTHRQSVGGQTNSGLPPGRTRVNPGTQFVRRRPTAQASRSIEHSPDACSLRPSEPQMQRGTTGNGRPAPCCEYCGAATILGRSYRFSAGVEKKTEEWFCTRSRRLGHCNPTSIQYPLSEYERRG